MKIVKQLSIFLKNRPGTLFGVSQHLAEAGINILGISVSDTVDHAVVRLVVDEPVRALYLLGDAGVLVIENDILVVPLKNRSGEMADLAKRLGEAEINIEYAYGGLNQETSEGVIYVRVSAPEKAIKLFA